MRLRALTLTAALAACQSVSPAALDNGGGGGGGGSGSGQGTNVECAIDADCALAAAKCCDCPTFAVPLTDPAHRACEGISCPVSSCPMNARATCSGGACVLACAPVACQLACAQGYAIDPTGCLECACADIPAPACTGDSDCVRTRADCCGCARGGADTAVAAGDQPAFDANLACPTDPQCPGGDTCAAGTAPACIEGACQLVTAAPANACSGACAGGQQCVLNSDADATMHGLGVCM
jgi:hypothetical protein